MYLLFTYYVFIYYNTFEISASDSILKHVVFLGVCCTGLVMVSLSGYLIEVMMSWTIVFSLITLVNATGLGIFLIFGDARRVDLQDSCPVITL